ncbi:SMI1/KNR4 family protein [Streptomyces sp. TX20-6-3]|uniref:SMI1/KNR4 family protein n=1 Tax=Streptomyces sp. TX20-6-3 TaxID=3028705 RepID=UPI0029A7A6C0|nr:SMI1/KNR4 family protein [Streptomyces sp. TX20-6-3]MDX2565229.1 SMI1/KNR4 family protein [Streptomyces sp. TX20-6-3]
MSITIPASFETLHRSGRFDYWGAPYHSLSEAERIRLHDSRQAEVLWWNGVEWDSSPDDVKNFAGDNRLSPGLYPFASTGHGDLYCWYPRWQEGPEPPVILYIHDELESPLFASNFSEFLCRGLLRSFAGTKSDLGTFEIWRRHIAIISPFLDPAYLQILAALGTLPDPTECAEADQRIAARLPVKKIIGSQPPTRYNEEFICDRTILLRLYDESVAYYRDLVANQGMKEFRSKLHDAETARARVAYDTSDRRQ